MYPRPKNTQSNASSRMEWLETVILTDKGAEGFDVSPDGKELWTASSESRIISIIDLEAKKLSAN